MKRLLLINPNISEAMTRTIDAAARARLPGDIELVSVTASFGFPVVATRLSYAVAAHAAVEAYASAPGRFDAVVLACFGDPGLEALRELAPIPVTGFAEASFRAALALGEPYAVITIGQAWVGMLSERVAAAQASQDFVGVFAADGTGLDALAQPEIVQGKLAGLVRQAMAIGARTIILGGASLAGWAPRLPGGAVYIDCIQAAMAQACVPAEPFQAAVVSQPLLPQGLSGTLREMLVCRGSLNCWPGREYCRPGP
jgi:allantoin racemase